MKKKKMVLWLLAAGLLCGEVSMNAQTGFYSMQHPEWPLLPCNCLNLPTHWLSNSVYGTFYAIEDLDFDYSAQSKNDLSEMMEQRFNRQALQDPLDELRGRSPDY